MDRSPLTIQGNEINGYMVVQKDLQGEWTGITPRYSTYDEANDALRSIENR